MHCAYFWLISHSDGCHVFGTETLWTESDCVNVLFISMTNTLVNKLTKKKGLFQFSYLDALVHD